MKNKINPLDCKFIFMAGGETPTQGEAEPQKPREDASAEPTEEIDIEDRKADRESREASSRAQMLMEVVTAEIDFRVNNINFEIEDKTEAEKIKAETKSELQASAKTLWGATSKWFVKHKLDNVTVVKRTGTLKALFDIGTGKDPKDAVSETAQAMARETNAETMVNNFYDVEAIKKAGGEAAVQELMTIYKAYEKRLDEIVKKTVRRVKEEKGLEGINTTPEQRALWEKYKDMGQAQLAEAMKQEKMSLGDQVKAKAFLERARAAIDEAQVSPEMAGELKKGGFIAVLMALLKEITKLFGGIAKDLGLADEESDESTERLAVAPESIFPGEQMYITSEIGHRDLDAREVGRENHPGIDIRAAAGTPFHAPAPMKIVKSTDTSRGHGSIIVGELQDGSGRRIMFAHLSERAKQEGEEVKAGEVLGKTGNSGTSNAPHLHIEMLTNGGDNFDNAMRFFGPHLKYSEKFQGKQDQNPDETQMAQADTFLQKQTVTKGTKEDFNVQAA